MVRAYWSPRGPKSRYSGAEPAPCTPGNSNAPIGGLHSHCRAACLGPDRAPRDTTQHLLIAARLPVTSPIHATNAWNPTGHNLLPVAGTRLFYTHADALNGPRTFVLLGDQRHLTFVADLDEHVDPLRLRAMLIERCGLYPHLVDLEPSPGLPRLFKGEPSERHVVP